MRTATRVGLALASVTAIGIFVTHEAQSADHRDALATKTDPASDINDVYTFADKDRVILAMTVFPFAGGGANFSNATQYVFHTSSGPDFGKDTSKVDVICTFASATAISCWIGTEDYVTGDPSDAAKPLTSKSGKVKVFAGLRADPFFFNLSGFVDTVGIVKGAAASLTFDPAGCPGIDAPTSQALVDTLKEIPSKANPSRTNPDDFASANALALVLSVDRSLLAKDGSVVSVWASTNKARP